jgi:TolA-binding protein
MRRRSRLSAPRIVRRPPWWVFLVKLTVAVGLLAVVAWKAFEFGQGRAGFDSAAARAELLKVRDEKAGLELEIARLRQRIAMLERAGQVDEIASIEAKDQLRSLQGDVVRLKEDLAFYQNLVTPGEAQSGIRLQSLKIQARSRARSYKYTLGLTKIVEAGEVVEGVVRLWVEGAHGGESESLPLEELSPDGTKKHNFKFRNFQNIQGTINLPEGFEPSAVKVEAVPEGKGLERLVKVFDWSAS